MNKFKYYYIDDESDATINSYINSFNNTDKIEVERLSINKETAVEEVANKIFSLSPDGLILDFRLNESGEFRQNYTATTLAQHIRTQVVLENKLDFPIIVFSTMSNINDCLEKDTSSMDLFDLSLPKDRTNDEQSLQLQAIADAYKKCSSSNVSKSVLLHRENFEDLSDDIFDPIGEPPIRTYKAVNYILKEIIGHPGILIDERRMAARLGINIPDCKEAWISLKKLIDSTDIIYKGILSEAWPRYWADKLFAWFKETTGRNIYSLDASQRVNLLKESCQIGGLKATKPIDCNESTYFDTICEVCQKPMDSTEGLELKEANNIASWQEHRYVSFYEVGNGEVDEKMLSSAGIKKKKIIQEINNE